MSLIGILFLIVFLGLLTKAIIETIWGICLIIYGLFWHTIGYSLSALAMIIRLAKKILGISKKPQPRVSLSAALKRVYGV